MSTDPLTAPEPDPADQPNDGFVKFVFTHPDEAIGFLRAYLPEPLPAICDWASLEILPSAYVSEKLGQSHGDILYRIRVADIETWIHIRTQQTPTHHRS